MSLIETLLVKLGPAITKSILAIWLNDANLAPNFTTDAVADFIDVFRGKTDDVIAQRRAARQFVDIGERVAESLLTIFENEARHLDEASSKAIIIAVSKTLTEAKISSSLLAKNDLDPNKFAKYLIDFENHSRHFTANESHIFHRVLKECSQCIIDIASSLPNFSEQTFAELLKRDRKLLSIATQILQTVQSIREISQRTNSNQITEYFEYEYRRNVERKLGKIQLFGLEASRTSTSYGLSTAYITLMVNRKRYLGANRGYDYVTIEEELKRTNRLLLLGPPGSGKTTLLQWIAVNAATNSFADDLVDWKNRVPFFVRLREFAHSNLPTPKEFIKILAMNIYDEMPQGWVSNLLRSGRAIVLVDGVDELPNKKREEVREWIVDLWENYPKANYVITSRPYAVTPYWLSREFSTAVLQPMNLNTVDNFVTRWHSAVREGIADEDQKDELTSLEENLKKTFRSNRSIRNLATNPLLCAMLCALHRDKFQNLPTRRVALYDAACRMLLEGRDKHRKITSQYSHLDFAQKQALLQRLAYWMLRNNKPQASREEAEHQFDIGIKMLQGINDKLTVAQFYQVLIERSGIVHEPEIGVIDFVHRTFLEYLAALAAIDERDIGALIKNSGYQEWREVIILAAGIADAKGRKDLINGLIERGDNKYIRNAPSYFLAAACLEATVEIDPKVKSKLDSRIADLIPPDSLDRTRELASAGELVAPYLVAKDDYKAETSILCIRTLKEIKGEAAIDALATFFSDTRKTVQVELTKTWQAFDREEFAKKVYSNCSQLIFQGDTDISGCKYLSGLTKIIIEKNSELFSLSPLEHQYNLQELSLHQCNNLNNLKDISYLNNLKTLTISECKELEDISPISRLNKLEFLSLRGCKNIRTLDPLEPLHMLRVLDIRGLIWTSDLSIVAGLRNLEKLVTDRAISEEDIVVLKQIVPRLKVVESL